MATYIGIDVGKKSMQVYLPWIDKSLDITNNEAGFTKLVNKLTKHYEQLADLIIVFEPTGGYEKPLREFLKSNQINFTTVHPNKVRNYARAKGWLAKTDKIDSKLLFDYATVFSLPIKQDYNTESQQKLHSLIKRREQLILIKNQEIARLDKAANDTFIKKSLEEVLSCLEKQLTAIENVIKELCENDVEIKSKFDRLTAIPGVGIVLATTVVCEVPEIGNIDFRKLTSLVGLAPFARDSGQYRGKRSIFAGRSNLRKVLYMAAVASLRCNHKLKSYYDRLIANHKLPKVALVAVMRKLLAFMHALFKNNTVWLQHKENISS
jgi:transposase